MVVDGTLYVLVEVAEFRRLTRQSGNAAADADELPPLPTADAKGNRPAVEYIRVSIARELIQKRQAAGLTQQELAGLAGVRQETLCRLETGKHSPTVRTVEKITKALEFREQRQGRGKRR